MTLEKMGRKGCAFILGMLCITLLAALNRPIEFHLCFEVLIGAFVAGNYGEHKEKAKVAIAEASNADPKQS